MAPGTLAAVLRAQGSEGLIGFRVVGGFRV